MDEARPSLLGHHNSDGTIAAGRLPVATEDYEPLIHRRIVVVYTWCKCLCILILSKIFKSILGDKLLVYKIILS
jgi:hypothetical protein